MPKEVPMKELLKQETELEKNWVKKYGTDDAQIARFRKARQEAVRDGIAEQDHHNEIMKCIRGLDTIDAEDPHAHILMSKIKMKFDMHSKMLNKYVGDIKSVELTEHGSTGESGAQGVSRAVEILGELAKRGLERDVTPSRKDGSVVSTQVSSEQEGHGGSSQSRLAVRPDEGSTE